MDDAELNLSVWIYCLDCLWESLESIHAGNEDFFYPAILQSGNYLKPEFSTLVFRSPHAKHLFDAIYIDADSKVDRLVDDPAFMTHLDSDSVKVDDGIDFVQWAVLLQQYLVTDSIGNLGNQGRRATSFP